MEEQEQINKDILEIIENILCGYTWKAKESQDKIRKWRIYLETNSAPNSQETKELTFSNLISKSPDNSPNKSEAKDVKSSSVVGEPSLLKQVQTGSDTIQSTETKVSVSQKPACFQDKHKAEIDKDYVYSDDCIRTTTSEMDDAIKLEEMRFYKKGEKCRKEDLGVKHG